MFPVQFITLLIIILSIQSEVIDGLRILGVFPTVGKSHYILGETILKELVRKGHIIDVVSHYPQMRKLENYNDISLAGSVRDTANNLTFEQAKNYGFNIRNFDKLNGRNICDLFAHPKLQELIQATPKGTYDVIIFESFFAPCYIALGQQLDAPVVALVSCKLHDWLYKPFGNTLNPSYIPSAFANLAQKMSFWERLENAWLINTILANCNYYFNFQIELVEKYFNRKLSSLDELYDDISLVLVNEHFSMNGIQPLTPDIIDVGGLHVHDDDQKLTPDLQKWLDESIDGCLYFSFGSQVKIESLPGRILKIFYETFERIAPVRVLMKIVDVNALPDGLPKNVKTSSWLPQIAVFKHKNTKAFITHGGLLSTQEAVAYKVPMIGLPIFGDQPNNVQNYAHRKIAIALSIDTLTVDLMTNAVRSVLEDPMYRENINKVSELFLDRPMSALDTAVYWVEYTAKHGKVLKSPATQLTWWQLNLLDVYGFIIICFLIIIIIIKRILLFLWKFSCNNSSKNVLKTKKNE